MVKDGRIRVSGAEKLRGLRESHGYTQEQAGEKLGVKQNTVAAWEKGERVPDRETLRQIIELYDCEPEDFPGTDSESDMFVFWKCEYCLSKLIPSTQSHWQHQQNHVKQIARFGRHSENTKKRDKLHSKKQAEPPLDNWKPVKPRK